MLAQLTPSEACELQVAAGRHFLTGRLLTSERRAILHHDAAHQIVSYIRTTEIELQEHRAYDLACQRWPPAAPCPGPCPPEANEKGTNHEYSGCDEHASGI